jgi:phosphatidylserine/phosphatidylglycerophosphate/cardiolipin synthase-like enzyme
VRLTIEGNVFGTPRINTPLVKKLKEAGILVVYANNHRYTFTHAKFWIIDQSYSISTGNWTASFFTKNREYIYTGTDTGTLRFLEEIYTADAEHMPFRDTAMIPSHIVMSPLDARSKIESLISRTQDSVILYVQTLSDERIIDLLSELIQSGKRVEICTADNESNQERQKEFPSWHWKLVRKPYIHAKVIIVDGREVFVGSHNLTTNAIQNNREMGVILHGRNDIIHQIENDFIADGCR